MQSTLVKKGISLALSAVTVGSIAFTVGIGSAAAGGWHDSHDWSDTHDWWSSGWNFHHLWWDFDWDDWCDWGSCWRSDCGSRW